MKNIHVLSTPNLSRLFENTNGDLSINDELQPNGIMCQNINIYITSDEEIKDPCFIFNNCVKTVKYYDFYNIRDTFTQYPSLIKHCKKIILTTDQDLIKDGVQAIDDEFLEWFVKNPTCESVEVIKYEDNSSPMLVKDKTFHYKIIIPKEETKYISIIEKMKPLQEQWQKDMDESLKPKQETLEEAAKRFTKVWFNNNAFTKELFIEGVKWQQERSYSKDEVKQLLIKFYQDNNFNGTIEEWFEKFKK